MQRAGRGYGTVACVGVALLGCQLPAQEAAETLGGSTGGGSTGGGSSDGEVDSPSSTMGSTRGTQDADGSSSDATGLPDDGSSGQPEATDDAPLPPTSVSVQGIVDDMAQEASCPIAELVGGQIQPVTAGGYPSTQSAITMGFMAHGQASPVWWNPSAGFEWVRTANWPVLTPWIVALSCIDNGASQTRIEMRNFRAYALLHSTGTWSELVGPSTVDGFVCPPGQWDNCNGETDIVIEGGVTSVLAAGTGSNFHGWSTVGGRIDEPNDVQLYVATIEARVVGPDVDDARYVLHVGTDYYPDGVGVTQLGGYNPGAGFSRSKILGTEWETVSFATIDASPSINDGQWVAPTALLEAQPPPGFEP